MGDKEQKQSRNFFINYDDSDESDSSEEEEEVRRKKQKVEAAGDQSAGAAADQRKALPAPEELFRSVSRPAFLYNPHNKQINWDHRTVPAPQQPPREFKVWKSNAVPPPQSYEVTEKKGAPPGMDMAIKWSSVYEDNGDDAPHRQGQQVHFLPDDEPQLSGDEDEESSAKTKSAKKRHVETFQQKEKRKRDLGQATSDKNFVEEEKRILRQNVE